MVHLPDPGMILLIAKKMTIKISLIVLQVFNNTAKYIQRDG